MPSEPPIFTDRISPYSNRTSPYGDYERFALLLENTSFLLLETGEKIKT